MLIHSLPGVPLVESPFFEELVGGLPDEETQRAARSLNRDGVAVITFPEPDLDAIAERLWTDLASHYAGTRQAWGSGAQRVRDAWQFHDLVKRLATNRGVMTLLRNLYGREPFPFQTMNFRTGSQQTAHIDAAHFHSVPERFMVGVWLALEDTDDQNGPLVYYPGSHKLPFYGNELVGAPAATPGDPYASHDRFDTLWQELIRVHGFERRLFHAKKGQALIWAANLLHGGAKQTDPSRTRHSQVTHYFFKGCSYYTPFCSSPFTGRIFFRQPIDIGTGEPVENTVNGVPVPPAFLAAATSSTYEDSSGSQATMSLSVSSLQNLFSTRDVQPRHLSVEGEAILLHPNGVGGPCATLAIDDIQLQGENCLSGVIEVANERSHPVEFGIEVRHPDGNQIAARTYRVEGGRQVDAHLGLPDNLTRCSLTLSTQMAPGAESSAYAWARFLNLRFTLESTAGLQAGSR